MLSVAPSMLGVMLRAVCRRPSVDLLTSGLTPAIHVSALGVVGVRLSRYMFQSISELARTYAHVCSFINPTRPHKSW